MKLKQEILEIINKEIVLQSTDCPWRYAPEFAAEKIEALIKQKLNIHGVMQGLALRMQDCPPDIAEAIAKNFDKLLDSSPTVGREREETQE